MEMDKTKDWTRCRLGEIEKEPG